MNLLNTYHIIYLLFFCAKSESDLCEKHSLIYLHRINNKFNGQYVESSHRSVLSYAFEKLNDINA